MTFTVTGMTCATCARIVEQALKKIEGVNFASVNLATSTGFVLAEREIDFEKIKKAIEEVGYGVETGLPQDIEVKRYRQAKRDLLIAWLISLPLIFLMIFHMFMVQRTHLLWMEVLFSAFAIFYIARKTIKGAWIALTHKHFNMDVLISLGAIGSWMSGVIKLAGLPVASFASIGAMIVAFHVTGRFIESYLRDKASKQLKSLAQLQAREARVINDSSELSVPIEAVKEGFIVLVKPSEKIPVDGVIVEGTSSIDESVITGESVPTLKREGDTVTSGSLNLTSTIKIKVTKVGEDTFLSQMLKLIQQAQGFKTPIQILADRITNWFVPTVILLAISSSVLWYFYYPKFSPFLEKIRRFFPWIVEASEPLSFSIFVFVSTIVIACPCALGLATPMALLVGTTRAMKKGLLVRNAEAIQTMKDVRFILMDKTGTLTLGEPKVVEHNLDQRLLSIVASIEKRSNHPFAKAISGLAHDEVEIESFKEIAGEGVVATFEEKEYFIGKPTDHSRYEKHLSEGRTVVEVRMNETVVGFFALEDAVREDAEKAVQKLESLKIEPVMVTGDNERTAQSVAKKLGIEKVHSGLKPQEKLELVRYYQSMRKKVAMVGDGMNDAAALKAADVGIAMGSGTDIAMESADVIIVRGGISKVVEAVEISNKTFKKIKQNLFWAFFYNVVAIPSAMMGLLHPLLAETAMILSSITVTINSLSLRREDA
ncbi:cation-translocating P-type ATPase [Pseudothermotoga sp.]|uniref:heavy metal translocating P-type ATPase n=1 Tax=Pseudothermotoga sp. TaxID=2033661 RepID=UPI0031F6B1F8